MKLLRSKMLILCLFSYVVIAEESTCYGTTSKGHLENAIELPSSGTNFVGYSDIARLAGRTYVHSQVKNILVDLYKLLETEHPNKVFKYAKTGFEAGGQLKPHKTHRNGLSVQMPTHPLNKFGYHVDFDIPCKEYVRK